MNPVFAGLAKMPEEWEFSSYAGYIGFRADPFIAPSYILSHFSSIKDYKNYVETLTDPEFEKISKTIWERLPKS